MNKEDTCFMSAFEMREKIKSQEITSSEITEIIIERIDKVNPIVNAYCTTTFDLARDMAKNADNAAKKGDKLGIIHGIPTSIKDLILTKGIRTTFGCKIHENYVPEVDEIVVKRLKNEGMVFLGKTNTPTFGYFTLTDNFIFGPTKNPWDITRHSGGSSGGAGAQVAAGLGPLALGSDGGGSIRVPSCFCGIYGLKPTFGRIPRYPTHDVGWVTMDHYGPMVRYVKDAALMLDAMAGLDLADKYSLPKPNYNYVDVVDDKPSMLKIGYSTNLGFIKAIDEEVENLFIQSTSIFEDLGWIVEEAKIKLKKPFKSHTTLVTAGYAYDLKPYLKDWRDKLEVDFLRMVDAGFGYSAVDLKQAEDLREKIHKTIYQYFKNYDLLLTPVTGIPALKLEERSPAKIRGKSVNPAEWFSFLTPFNLTGHPAASIPCGWTKDGLPVGLQIIGRRLDEATVLQASKAFEDLKPWQKKRPHL